MQTWRDAPLAVVHPPPPKLENYVVPCVNRGLMMIPPMHSSTFSSFSFCFSSSSLLPRFMVILKFIHFSFFEIITRLKDYLMFSLDEDIIEIRKSRKIIRSQLNHFQIPRFLLD